MDEYQLATGVFPPSAVDRDEPGTLVQAHIELFDPVAPWNVGNEVYASESRNFSLATQGSAMGFDEPADLDRYLLTPTSWLFLELISSVGDAEAVIADMPAQSFVSDVLNPGLFSQDPLTRDPARFAIRQQVVDAWGNPILFVQPGSAAAEGLFGKAQNGRPYFLSAGLDQNYGIGPEVRLASGGTTDERERELIGYTEDNVTSSPVGDVITGGSFASAARLQGTN